MKLFIHNFQPELIDYTSSIRDKICIIKLLLQISTYLLIDGPNSNNMFQNKTDDNSVNIIICIDKMKRIFVEENDKIHSFHFPFTLKILNDRYLITCINYEINSETCSILNTLFYSSIFENSKESTSIYDVIEELWNNFETYNIKKEDQHIYEELTTYLLSFEPGYLRFDHDETREDESLHPLNHIDFNYSNSTTFKFGLHNSLKSEDLIKIIDNQNPRYYLSNSIKNK